MNYDDNQGRGERPQLPEGSGWVWCSIVGGAIWCALMIVADAVRSAL